MLILRKTLIMWLKQRVMEQNQYFILHMEGAVRVAITDTSIQLFMAGKERGMCFTHGSNKVFRLCHARIGHFILCI